MVEENSSSDSNVELSDGELPDFIYTPVTDQGRYPVDSPSTEWALSKMNPASNSGWMKIKDLGQSYSETKRCSQLSE